jgi:hypothetical protein
LDGTNDVSYESHHLSLVLFLLGRLLKFLVFPGDFDQLGFMFDDKYYFDKCLPMGASISCVLFEKCSTALHWFTETRTGNRDILHYLDDFLFRGEADSTRCKDTLLEFKGVCELWQKTKLSNRLRCLLFGGVEFDTRDMILRLPGEKLEEVKSRLQNVMKANKVIFRELY